MHELPFSHPHLRPSESVFVSEEGLLQILYCFPSTSCISPFDDVDDADGPFGSFCFDMSAVSADVSASDEIEEFGFSSLVPGFVSVVDDSAADNFASSAWLEVVSACVVVAVVVVVVVVVQAGGIVVHDGGGDVHEGGDVVHEGGGTSEHVGL